MLIQTTERPYNVARTLASRREDLVEAQIKAEQSRIKANGPITWASGKCWATPCREELRQSAVYWEGVVARYRTEIAWLEAWPGEWFGMCDKAA